MNKLVNDLINTSNLNGKYQKMFVFFCFLTWLNFNMLDQSVHMFNKFTYVKYKENPDANETEMYMSEACSKSAKDEYSSYYISQRFYYSIVLCSHLPGEEVIHLLLL